MYIYIYILGLYWDNAKSNGNYYLEFRVYLEGQGDLVSGCKWVKNVDQWVIEDMKLPSPPDPPSRV